MSRENRLRGAPRIHDELLKVGIEAGETSVSKYLVRSRKPPSKTWRTFLENHVKTMVSVDFFTVPAIRFQVLYVLLALAHERRRIVHFHVTAHPTAEWTTHRRECLDHVIVFNETSLRRTLAVYPASRRPPPPVRAARSLNFAGRYPGPRGDKCASTCACLRIEPPCAHQRHIRGARGAAKPSRRSLAAGLPHAFEPRSVFAGANPDAYGVCRTHRAFTTPTATSTESGARPCPTSLH